MDLYFIESTCAVTEPIKQFNTKRLITYIFKNLGILLNTKYALIAHPNGDSGYTTINEKRNLPPKLAKAVLGRHPKF